LSIIETKLEGTIDGEYLPWTGASNDGAPADAERAAVVVVGAAGVFPLDPETHPAASRPSNTTATTNIDRPTRMRPGRMSLQQRIVTLVSLASEH
jgi:hypothetical protein